MSAKVFSPPILLFPLLLFTEFKLGWDSLHLQPSALEDQHVLHVLVTVVRSALLFLSFFFFLRQSFTLVIQSSVQWHNVGSL